MEMSLKYCLATFIIVVQSAVALSKEPDHLDPLKYLLSNETSVLMSSDYYYHDQDDSNLLATIIVYSLFCAFIFLSLLLGLILLCICKPKQTPGRILSTNKLEEGREAVQSSSSPMSNNQCQPPLYQAAQSIYPPITPVISPQKSPYSVEFQNPIGGTVKPGRIISAKYVVENQPQSTHVQQHFPQSQPPYPQHPASQQQFINAETSFVMGTQDAGHVTEFNNPVANS